MRVLVLTWEFPPRRVGKLADHVGSLTARLVAAGNDVHVVTFHDVLRGYRENADGVKVCWVDNPVKTHVNVITWALTLNQAFVKAASEILRSTDRFDVVDAHEWLCVPAAVGLKRAFGIPFVFSIHTIEDHRSGWADAPLNLSIKSIEWLGTHEAEVVIVQADWMVWELARVYQVPIEKVRVADPRSETWVGDVLRAYEAAIRSSKRAGRS